MDFKTYAKSYQNTICLELDRVKALLERCGNPDSKLEIVHVAGTNGKGSVCSFICEGLAFDGKKCGRFSSPELFDVTDTISINSQSITSAELDSLYEYLAPHCSEIEAKYGKAPSQFEINFAAALCYFVGQGCTHAVIECGMGGLGDATNAIGDSSVSVITKISLDHEAYLGDTVQKIAANKCGIFKKSSSVFIADQNDDVIDTARALADGRPFCVVPPLPSLSSDGMHQVVSVGNESVRLSLAGIHQRDNASLAAAVLSHMGAGVESIKYALEHARNRARLERIDDNVYFDGAHNPDGIMSLIHTINQADIKGKIIFAAGFMADKDYKRALSCLDKLNNRNFELYTTAVRSNPRSESAKALAECARSLGFRAKEFDNIRAALEQAKSNADTVFVIGSLYMYKEVMI